MAWDKSRSPDLLDDLMILMRDLCVEWGVCVRLLPDDLLNGGKILTAEEFARAVVTADGGDAEHNKWLEPIRDKFIERYGASVSLDSYTL
jgi:hypothetical protein